MEPMSRCEHYGNQATGNNPPHWHRCNNPAEFDIPGDGLYCLKHKDEIAEEDQLVENVDYYFIGH